MFRNVDLFGLNTFAVNFMQPEIAEKFCGITIVIIIGIIPYLVVLQREIGANTGAAGNRRWMACAVFCRSVHDSAFNNSATIAPMPLSRSAGLGWPS
jgi:hypothetical protein